MRPFLIQSENRGLQSKFAAAMVLSTVLGMVLFSPLFWQGKVGADSTLFQATASPTPTLFPVCTAPACRPDEVYYCPGACPGGCGTMCATRTPTPGAPSPPMPALPGAFIALQVGFPEGGLDYHWQELWTIVQWQDAFGRWHDVSGWQGTLDRVRRSGPDVIGQKVWWLASDLFGKGPFRWLVYRAQGGAVLAESEPFSLPDAAGEVEAVEISFELATGE
jgi:hypothetical protein